MENEETDAGRDCRTCLARPNSQGANGNREKIMFPFQLTTSRVGKRLIYTLLYVIIHKCMHIYIRKYDTVGDGRKNDSKSYTPKKLCKMPKTEHSFILVKYIHALYI